MFLVLNASLCANEHARLQCEYQNRICNRYKQRGEKKRRSTLYSRNADFPFAARLAAVQNAFCVEQRISIQHLSLDTLSSRFLSLFRSHHSLSFTTPFSKNVEHQPIVPERAVPIARRVLDNAVLGRQAEVPVARIEADAVYQIPQRAVLTSALLGCAVVAVDLEAARQAEGRVGARSVLRSKVRRRLGEVDDLTRDVRLVRVGIVDVGEVGERDVDGDRESDLLTGRVVEAVWARGGVVGVVVFGGASNIDVTSVQLDRRCSSDTDQREKRKNIARDNHVG